LQNVGFFVIFVLYHYYMKKAPKIEKYAKGGEIPKFKTRAEHDKYYTGLGYKQMPGSKTAGYYDPKKYEIDAAGKWKALTPDASVTFGWGGVGNGPKDFYSFDTAKAEIENASPGKVVVEDTKRKPVFTGDPNYETYQYADELGQYGNATTKYFDKKTGTEIDPSKSFDVSGKYVPRGFKDGGETPKKFKAPSKATKVTVVPKDYNKLGEEGNKTYYDKKSDAAIPGGSGGDEWEQSIIKRLQSGVSPDELVKAGHISYEQMPKFQPYYNPIYTEKDPVAKAGIPLDVSNRIDRKQIFTGNLEGVNEFEYPDVNAGYSKSTKRYFDAANPDKEIDVNKLSYGADKKPVFTYINSAPGVMGTEKSGVGQNIGADGSLQETKNPLTKAMSGGFAKGGLVEKLSKGGKVKGYFLGTSKDGVTDYGDASAIGGAAGQVAGLGGDYLNAKSMNEDGTVDKNMAAGAGALQGAKTGAAIGLNPALMAATGGLSALAIPAGAAIGAGVKYFGAKNLNEDIATAKAKAEEEKKAAENQAQFQSSLANQMLERQQGLAKGGMVKGKGGPTSDSISAIVKAGSFVVPAKNAPIAKEIKKMIAPSKKKEADLKQKGGTEVRLSDGEFLFTPEEKDEIEASFGEEMLEALAPEAENGEELKNGGPISSAKAKIILHEGIANGKPLTDAQRKYMGWAASGYKKGGVVQCMSDGGKVKGQKLTYKGQEVTFDGKDWVTKDGNIHYRGDLFDSYLNKQSEKKSAEEKKYSAQQIDALKRHYDFIKDKPDRKAEAERTLAKINGTTDSKIPSKSGAEIEKSLGVSGGKSKPKVNVTADVLQSKSPIGDVTEKQIDIKETDNSVQDTEAINTVKANLKPSKSGANNEALGKGLGLVGNQLAGLGNYILPYQQYKMGQKFLAQTGKRPVDKIDPDFLKTVTRAQANAQFGYTPEEQALIDSNNVSALRAGQNAAKNYSGGSASNAFNLTRSAANDFYGRGLQSAIANKNLMLNKQAYADQLNQSKADMSRRLFQDTIGAWKENQNAGGNLVGNAIQNMIGANRLNQEMRFQSKLAQNSNPYAQYKTNPLDV